MKHLISHISYLTYKEKFKNKQKTKGLIIMSLGYDDTPTIPGSIYKVHDGERPQPKVVEPTEWSQEKFYMLPPSDAVVLFDGTDLSGWTKKGDASTPAGWKVENGYMEVVPGTGDIQTKELIGDCQLHVEFAAPEVVKGDGQGRGNSGVFLMGKYEFQVLDCFDNPTYSDGTVGSIYGQYPPLVNPSRKPGEWQTYDIIWEAPKFDETKLISPARATILLNGVVVQNAQVLQGPTDHRVTTKYVHHDAKLPLALQDHGDLVRFRNIWYREIGEAK
jgi:hypothetical protein